MKRLNILACILQTFCIFLWVGDKPVFAASDEIPPPPANSDAIMAQALAHPESTKASYVYKVPSKLSDGWKVGDLRKQKADLKLISAGVNKILAGTIPDVHSLVVVRHGEIFLDEYFKGYTADYANPLYSCTK